MNSPLDDPRSPRNAPAVARKLRLQSQGAIYHVMNRGDDQEPIFRGAQDRELFVKTLGAACAKTDWQVHAWWPTRNGRFSMCNFRLNL